MVGGLLVPKVLKTTAALACQRAGNRQDVDLLRRAHRKFAFMALRRYRTISGEAAFVLSRDLDTIALASIYHPRQNLASGASARSALHEEEQDAALKVWESRLATSFTCWKMIEALPPILHQRLVRHHGVLTL